MGFIPLVFAGGIKILFRILLIVLLVYARLILIFDKRILRNISGRLY
jgi:hypothetical protein